MSCFVYVIHEFGCDAPVKIGRAAFPQDRLANLQCGNHRKLVIAGLRECADLTEAVGVERACHLKFADSRIGGEWFSVDHASALEFAKSTAPVIAVNGESVVRDVVLQRAIDLAGGVSDLARKLNVSRQAISQWATCPYDRIREVCAATGWRIMPRELAPELAEQFAPIQVVGS